MLSSIMVVTQAWCSMTNLDVSAVYITILHTMGTRIPPRVDSRHALHALIRVITVREYPLSNLDSVDTLLIK